MNETPIMPPTATLKTLTPKRRLTALELYAIVQKTARTHRGASGLNTLRQIDAGQQVRLRTVLERDAALTFVARSKGLHRARGPAQREGGDRLASNATMRLKTLPHGDRRVRRLAARELDRAKRRMSGPKPAQ